MMDDNELAAFNVLMGDIGSLPTVEQLHQVLLRLEQEGMVEYVSGEGADTVWRQTEKGKALAKQILARMQN